MKSLIVFLRFTELRFLLLDICYHKLYRMTSHHSSRFSSQSAFAQRYSYKSYQMNQVRKPSD